LAGWISHECEKPVGETGSSFGRRRSFYGTIEKYSCGKGANRLSDLLQIIREVSRSNDLSLIIATERTIVEKDLDRHANSPAMTSSLKTALNEIMCSNSDLI